MPAKCLVPLCDRPGRLRGLCRCHYTNALDNIRKGRTSQAELMALGLLNPRLYGVEPSLMSHVLRRRSRNAKCKRQTKRKT